MTTSFRRVVTGLNNNGVATVIADATARCILQRPNRPGVTLTDLWRSDQTPAQMERDDDPASGPLVLQPPANGSVFRIVQFDPENAEELARLNGKAAFAEMNGAQNIVEDASHPFMHRTNSLDYVVILSGEIYLMMDEEQFLLKAGDTVVQQGTNHAWSNRGTEPCVIAFVLQDAL